jgi:uncharacterized membrane protein YagU involved in acid resistance
MAEASSRYAAGATGGTLQRRLVGGALAGLVGGVLFGIIMGMGGMLPMVAGLVGAKDAVVGFIVHLVISAIIGAGFGLVFGGQAVTPGQGALWGAVYGFIWWILGPLLIMPTMMGMGPQFGMAFAPPMLMSLVGHLVYGVATGLAYPALARRFA